MYHQNLSSPGYEHLPRRLFMQKKFLFHLFKEKTDLFSSQCSAKQFTFSLSLNFFLSSFDIRFAFIFHEVLYFTFNWYIKKTCEVSDTFNYPGWTYYYLIQYIDQRPRNPLFPFNYLWSSCSFITLNQFYQFHNSNEQSSKCLRDECSY